jgi:hypothetical protein
MFFMKLLIIVIPILFLSLNCSHEQFKITNVIIDKSIQSNECDTIKSFGDSLSRVYLVRCDSMTLRYIYDKSGSVLVAYLIIMEIYF